MKVADFLVVEARPLRAIHGLMRGTCVGAVLLTLGACQMASLGGQGPTVDGQAEIDKTQKTLWSAARDAEDSNQYDVAANAYGRLYERRPQDAEVLAAFIRNMRYSGNGAAVTTFVDDKAQHLLGDSHVKFEYAKALLASGRKDQALVALHDVSAVMGDDWEVHSAIGVANDALGRFSQAIVAYDTALRLSPNNEVVMNNMAMSLAMSGQLDTAIATLERAADINRNNPHIRQNLALLYAVNGEVERARVLSAMDLDTADMETNLSFYRRFEGAVK